MFSGHAESQQTAVSSVLQGWHPPGRVRGSRGRSLEGSGRSPTGLAVRCGYPQSPRWFPAPRPTATHCRNDRGIKAPPLNSGRSVAGYGAGDHWFVAPFPAEGTRSSSAGSGVCPTVELAALPHTRRVEAVRSAGAAVAARAPRCRSGGGRDGPGQQSCGRTGGVRRLGGPPAGGYRGPRRWGAEQLRTGHCRPGPRSGGPGRATDRHPRYGSQIARGQFTRGRFTRGQFTLSVELSALGCPGRRGVCESVELRHGSPAVDPSAVAWPLTPTPTSAGVRVGSGTLHAGACRIRRTRQFR